LNFLSIKLERIFRELETFLDESGEFTNTTALLSEDFLSVSCTDDDLEYYDV
jgi:hypothetical protein